MWTLFKTLLPGLILLSLGHVALFSSSGWLVRAEIQAEIDSIREFQDQIQAENELLERKRELLRDDQNALQLAGKKFLLMDKDSRVLRFREPAALRAEKEKKAANPARKLRHSRETSPEESARQAAEQHRLWTLLYWLGGLILLTGWHWFRGRENLPSGFSPEIR